MFETNTQNNSTLISLARAAEITGYHQDYLGQLCRLGRLPAKKVGRNWFTSKLALRNLSAMPEETEELQLSDAPEVRTEEVGAVDVNAPAIAHNVTVSQVEGMPIMIRTLPVQVQSTNNVQSIVTQMRIEALQREVLELKQLLSRLMAEVTRHGELLQGRNFSDIWHRQDALKHSYVSNFDFSPPITEALAKSAQENPSETAPKIWSEPKSEFSVVTWMSATAVMVALAFMGVSMVLGTFWGTDLGNKTVYHHPKIESNQTVIDPAVAGASSELPPQNIESTGQNVVQ